MQRAIPCTLMRGGTSRAPFFLAKDLPSRESDAALLDAILLRTLRPLVDSLGGGPSVTTKAAVVSRSSTNGVNIDLEFAQIDAVRRRVDWTPLCGNILSAVAPFALEKGLVSSSSARGADAITDIVVRNVGTGAIANTTVCTPDGLVTYDGDCEIAGVEGHGAPVVLNFRDIAGKKTGSVLPTGNAVDKIDGIGTTVLDVAMPIMFMHAADFGCTGYESCEELNERKDTIEQMLRLRHKVQSLIGLSQDPASVLPKMVLVAPPRHSGHLSARYFTPWAAHPSFAVSGSICTAAAAAVPGSVVSNVVRSDKRFFEFVEIEHPAGSITASLDANLKDGKLNVRGGGCVRTVRKIMDGHVYVPGSLWD